MVLHQLQDPCLGRSSTHLFAVLVPRIVDVDCGAGIVSLAVSITALLLDFICQAVYITVSILIFIVEHPALLLVLVVLLWHTLLL